MLVNVEENDETLHFNKHILVEAGRCFVFKTPPRFHDEEVFKKAGGLVRLLRLGHQVGNASSEQRSECSVTDGVRTEADQYVFSF